MSRTPEQTQTTRYPDVEIPRSMLLCACRSCGDLAPDAIKEIDRLRAALQQIADMRPEPGGVGQIARDTLRVA